MEESSGIIVWDELISTLMFVWGLNFIGFDKWARSRSLSFAVVCITEEVRSSLVNYTFLVLLLVTVKWIMWTTWNMVNSLRTKEYFEIHKILYITTGLEKHTCYEISMFLWVMFSHGRGRRVIQYARNWWGWFVIFILIVIIMPSLNYCVSFFL